MLTMAEFRGTVAVVDMTLGSGPCDSLGSRSWTDGVTVGIQDEVGGSLSSGITI